MRSIPFIALAILLMAADENEDWRSATATATATATIVEPIELHPDGGVSAGDTSVQSVETSEGTLLIVE